MAQTTTSTLVSRLRSLLGPDAVLDSDDDLHYFAVDAMGSRGGERAVALPLAVVRPTRAEDVARLLKFATETETPVVAYGSGTGLMGGARTAKPGIVLDTNALNSIDVRADDRLVWAGAGAVLADVNQALAPHGRIIGHDPWTFPVATVGGTLSTNGLGYRGGRYGGMGDQAVALEVALADGTLLRTRAVSRHSAGPALHRWVIGSEGTLGVITAAALKTYPTPETRQLRTFTFESFADGFAAVDAIAALGLRPSLLDYGEEHASPWPGAFSRDEEPPVLHLGFEGLEEEVTFSLHRAEALVREQGGTAKGPEPAIEFWQDRHVIAERFRRGTPRGRNWRRGSGWDYMHVALPPSQVLAFQRDLHASTADAGVGLLECGLWTGPEFSPVSSPCRMSWGVRPVSQSSWTRCTEKCRAVAVRWSTSTERGCAWPTSWRRSTALDSTSCAASSARSTLRAFSIPGNWGFS